MLGGTRVQEDVRGVGSWGGTGGGATFLVGSESIGCAGRSDVVGSDDHPPLRKPEPEGAGGDGAESGGGGGASDGLPSGAGGAAASFVAVPASSADMTVYEWIGFSVAER